MTNGNLNNSHMWVLALADTMGGGGGGMYVSLMIWPSDLNQRDRWEAELCPVLWGLKVKNEKRNWSLSISYHVVVGNISLMAKRAP